MVDEKYVDLAFYILVYVAVVSIDGALLLA